MWGNWVCFISAAYAARCHRGGAEGRDERSDFDSKIVHFIAIGTAVAAGGYGGCEAWRITEINNGTGTIWCKPKGKPENAAKRGRGEDTETSATRFRVDVGTLPRIPGENSPSEYVNVAVLVIGCRICKKYRFYLITYYVRKGWGVKVYIHSRNKVNRELNFSTIWPLRCHKASQK